MHHCVSQEGMKNPLPECESDRGFDRVLLERDWSVTHARRGCDGREEGCECGYYYLHRNLNDSLFHGLIREIRLIRC